MSALICRGCAQTQFESILDYGAMPLVDRLIDPDDTTPEPRFPLELVRCRGCCLVQITERVPAEQLFGAAFPYHSRFSTSLLESFRAHADELLGGLDLDATSLVVDLGSNDGSMLKPFAERGIPVLGVDPAPEPAAYARSIGIETLESFFDQRVADKLVSAGRSASLVIAKNVLAHVPDQMAFLRAVRALLRDDGHAVFEFPTVTAMVDHGVFDTVYHEHQCCFSMYALGPMLERAGLGIDLIRRVPLQGGSLRVLARRADRHTREANVWIESEQALGVQFHDFYQPIATAAHATRAGVRRVIDDLRSRGRSIAAYGAAAKGALMLNWCALSPGDIDYVVDRNPHKHGKLMPGVRIPVRPVESLAAERPDAVVVLAWNYVGEIARQQADYLNGGGVFILPTPEAPILTAADLGV